MNVGIVIEQFDPRRGGVEQWTCQFVRHLASDGHEVHLLARSFAGGRDHDGWIPHKIGAGSGREEFAAQAANLLDRLNLDVVHDTGAGWRCHVFQPHGGSRRASIRQNLLLLAPSFRPWKDRLARWTSRYREFERLMAKQYVDDGRLFVALSQMVRNDFLELHRVPDEQIRLIYNGVDLQRFSPAARQTHRAAIREQLGIRDEETLFLIVAHNWALKGVPTLLAAHARLCREDLPSRVVVVGGKRPSRRSALDRGHRAETVQFVGGVDESVPYYAAADAYVHPTYYDPCSLVVLEALASGLPVVTSQFNGAGELITSGVEGAVIDDPADDEALADAMRPLFDTSRRHEMGQASRRLAERHPFTRNFDEMIEVYREVARRRHRGGQLRRAG